MTEGSQEGKKEKKGEGREEERLGEEIRKKGEGEDKRWNWEVNRK